MGADFNLLDPITKEEIHFDSPHQLQGGTYALGGTTEAWLSITYNYFDFYRKVIPLEDGLRGIVGMSAVDTIPILEEAISKLGDDVSSNYWDATEGNARRALIQLLTLAKMRPDSIWGGSF